MTVDTTAQLDDRVCVVTGAAQGMGRSIALMMAERGARAVVVLDRADSSAVCDEIRRNGAEALGIACDLRDREAIRSAVDEIVARFGGIDVLVNNAGVLERAFTNDVDFDTVPEELWDLVMDVNVKGAWLLSRFCAPHLRASRKSPAIVNAASIAGRTAFSHSIYGVSKAALIQLTRSMAMALAPDVRVNCYCPGTVDTDMSASARSAGMVDTRVAAITETNLIPRLARPEEIAEVACFLASPAASFITGVAYDVDGGAMAWRGHRRET